MIPRHIREYLWSAAMCALASYAYVRGNYAVMAFLAFGGGYCLNEGFHLTVAHLNREIDRIRGVIR